VAGRAASPLLRTPVATDAGGAARSNPQGPPTRGTRGFASRAAAFQSGPDDDTDGRRRLTISSQRTCQPARPSDQLCSCRTTNVAKLALAWCSDRATARPQPSTIGGKRGAVLDLAVLRAARVRTVSSVDAASVVGRPAALTPADRRGRPRPRTPSGWSRRRCRARAARPRCADRHQTRAAPSRCSSGLRAAACGCPAWTRCGRESGSGRCPRPQPNPHADAIVLLDPLKQDDIFRSRAARQAARAGGRWYWTAARAEPHVGPAPAQALVVRRHIATGRSLRHGRDLGADLLIDYRGKSS
jgi:hypothetical protein